MNKANYFGASSSSGGAGRYPVTLESLDFIQQQIVFLQKLTDLVGNGIISLPSGRDPGLIILNGELLPLRNASGEAFGVEKYITIKEEHQGATVDGVVYDKLRTLRYALRTSKPERGKIVIPERDIPLLQSIAHMQATSKTRLVRIQAVSDLDNYAKAGVYEVQGGVYPLHGEILTGNYKLIVEEVVNHTMSYISFPPILIRQTIVLSDAFRLQRYIGEDWDILSPPPGAILGVLSFRFSSQSSWTFKANTGVFRKATVKLPYQAHASLVEVNGYSRVAPACYIISSGERENVRGYSVEEVGSKLIVRGESLSLTGNTERAFTITAIAI